MQIYAPLHKNILPELVQIEVSLHFQIPTIKIIGLVSHEVQEAKERIFAAFEASGLEFPPKKIIINLPPASVAKKGTHFDLPMALAIFRSSFQHMLPSHFKCAASGELSLDGRVKKSGKLLRTLLGCLENKIDFLFLSKEEEKDWNESVALLTQLQNENEFKKKELPHVFFISRLSEVKKIFLNLKKNNIIPPPLTFSVVNALPTNTSLALEPPSEIIQRVLMLSIVGFHHMLLLGPKGVGKSSCLLWAEHIFFPLHNQLLIENYLIQELKNQKPDFNAYLKVGSLVRPYALVGSCTKETVVPGAFSLAHGKLFIADEFLEWHKDSLECLRTPLESKTITLNRLGHHYTFPTNFLFMGSSNLCPCGGYPKQYPLPLNKKYFYCDCSEVTQKHYLKKASGSLYERIDVIHFIWEQDAPKRGLKSPIDKERIKEKRNFLLKKLGTLPGLLTPKECEDYLHAHPKCALLLQKSLDLFPKYNNYRNKHKILKIALTLAALDHPTQDQGDSTFNLLQSHLTEALSYRFIP